MTVQLGSVVLSESLVLTGIESSPGLAYSAQRTLGGSMVVQVGPSFSGGRTLTLTEENHFTLAQINAIKAMESAGNPVVLLHHRGAFNVLIAGVDVEPAVGYADPDLDDWYSGTITLIEV